MKALMIAAPSSGAGKTTVTLALLRLLARQGVAVRGAKSGPDYIDPRFHQAACGLPSVNLDAWAMRPDRLRQLAANDPAGAPAELLVIEGAMGLFDGAFPDGAGSAAELARHLDAPVILVIDAGRMAQSVAALAVGFAGLDPTLRMAGVILNNVGSLRHMAMLQAALDQVAIPVLAALPRDATIALPSRHLGLVQAEETADLDALLTRAADALATGVPGGPTLTARGILSHARPLRRPAAPALAPRLAPPGQRIAVAQDRAFAFAYPHLLADWRAAGAEILLFSPLEDAPVPDADFCYLPGGYPELHAGRLAGAARFLNSLRQHATRAPVYGECGGYMVLGQGLVDAEGQRHAMAGLLGVETSFATRRRHLGYRRVEATHGPLTGAWRAHEFHYATTLAARGTPLFTARDAEGTALPDMGLRDGPVMGSFAHLIDRA
ncbi:cobyrinate a,c-diamide synthase [Pseudooceanicola aestuarii]|uniref:cobyrinate a,c-diamide synthase n=1 Tax=Pseudooceanicola aestuarii TaxID=2697319 RepID=UPI0013D22267|nr:cobyrinate a,c-diamide synthase [Pseudooceanicola aestuarii]